MPTVIIPPTDVSPNTGTGSEVLSNAPTLVNPIITGTIDVSGNITAADLILGSSGPSVKSTLSARAPRQGLVFDNTLKASITNGAILGTSDFTVAAWINRPASDLSVPLWGPSNSIGFAIRATQITVEKIGASLEAAWDYTVASSKFVSVVVKRSGTTYTCFVDGISIGDKTVGSVTNFSAAYSDVGFTNFTNGTIVGPYVYNRALSASEVVALYEAGAPAGADYNNASNTSLITGDNSTFASDTGYWTKSSATIGSGVCTLSAGGYIYKSSFYSGVGKRYRLVVTINSIVSGNLQVNTGNNGVNIPGATAPGTYTFDYSVDGPAPLAIGATTGQIVIDNVLIYPLGLLLAPDAAQAGGGLTWYDTSGNAANITLPASGVSWNVPSSQVLGGNWTTSGNLTVSGGTISSGVGNTLLLQQANYGGGLSANASGQVIVAAYNSQPLRLQTQGADALTISSSQNATLTGNLTVSGGSIINGAGTAVYFFGTPSNNYMYYDGSSLSIRLGGSDRLTISGATGDATFAGTIQANASSIKSFGAAVDASLSSQSYGGNGLEYYFKSNTSGNLAIGSTAFGDAFTITRSTNAATFSGQVISAYAGDWVFKAIPTGGADRNLALFGVSGATNGLTVKWDHSTTTMRINISNLPTSSSGLAAGDLYNSGGTIKIA